MLGSPCLGLFIRLIDRSPRPNAPSLTAKLSMSMAKRSGVSIGDRCVQQGMFLTGNVSDAWQ